MCRISSKIKLCSCELDDKKQLKDYWILYRYQDKNICLIGETILPYLGSEDNTYDQNELIKILNDGNCFDQKIKIENNDILELHFNQEKDGFSKKTTSLIYEFIYKNKEWKFNEHNPLNINKSKKKEGKIFNPFHK